MSPLSLSTLTPRLLQNQLDAILSRDSAVQARVFRAPAKPGPPAPSPAAPPREVDASSLLQIPGDAVFISESYLHLLRRPPAESELRQHQERLNASMSRLFVLHLIERQAAADSAVPVRLAGLRQRRTVDELRSLRGDSLVHEAVYTFFWREPSAEELSRYAAEAAKHDSPDHLLALLAATPEASLYPLPSQTPLELSGLLHAGGKLDFVHALYRTVLGRGPDPAGLQNVLRASWWMPRKRIILAFARSPEAQQRDVRFLWRGRPLDAPHAASSLRRLRLLPARLFDLTRASLYARLDSIEDHLARRNDSLVSALGAQSDAMTSVLARLDRLESSLAAAAQRQEESSRVEAARFEGIFAAAAVSARRQQTHASRLWSSLQDLRSKTAPPLRQQDAASAESRPAQLLDDLALRSPAPVIAAGDGLLITPLNGFLMAIPSEDALLAALLYFHGSIDRGLVRFLSHAVLPGMHVIDIGANIGIHTLIAASQVGPTGKVFSFEPTPRTFRILQLNLELNGLAHAVQPFPLAVSDSPGTAELYIHSTCGHNSLFHQAGPALRSIQVETVSLDHSAIAAVTPDLIKIDAEGAEPLIFRGMPLMLARNPRLRLIVEIAPGLLASSGFPPGDFLASLLSSGFTMRVIDDLSGELEPVSPEALLSRNSSNVLFERPPG